jgi:hypothetical protein
MHPTLAIEWGNVAEWVGAIGTTAAFGAAFFVILRDHAENRRRQREEEKRKRDEESRQARLIFPRVLTYDPDHLIIAVENKSQEAITAAS